MDPPDYPAYVNGEAWRSAIGSCTVDNPGVSADHRPGNVGLTIGGSNPDAGLQFFNNEVIGALCGSGIGLLGTFDVQSNYIGSNGQNGLPGALTWADGLSVQSCQGGFIGHNTLVDNTDIDLPVGGGGGCGVVQNVVAHFGKYAGAGITVGNFVNVPHPGNHTGSTYSGNHIYTGKVITQQVNGLCASPPCFLEPDQNDDPGSNGFILNHSCPNWLFA